MKKRFIIPVNSLTDKEMEDNINRIKKLCDKNYWLLKTRIEKINNIKNNINKI